MIELDEETNLGQSLQQGMYVRVPYEGRDDGEYRELRVGQVLAVDMLAALASVTLYNPGADGNTEKQVLQVPLQHVTRCSILPDSSCRQVSTGAAGRVLSLTEDAARGTEFQDYYVLIDGRTVKIGE